MTSAVPWNCREDDCCSPSPFVWVSRSPKDCWALRPSNILGDTGAKQRHGKLLESAQSFIGFCCSCGGFVGLLVGWLASWGLSVQKWYVGQFETMDVCYDEISALLQWQFLVYTHPFTASVCKTMYLKISSSNYTESALVYLHTNTHPCALLALILFVRKLASNTNFLANNFLASVVKLMK